MRRVTASDRGARSATAWIGIALVGLVVLATALLATRDADRRSTRRALNESSAVAALRQSVGGVLSSETALARVVGALGTPIGDRWPVLANIALSQPLANSAAFIEPVAQREVRRYERMTGLRLVQVPVPGARPQPAGDRPVHYVVRYAVQKTTAKPTLGLDLAANSVRAEVLAASARTNTQLATPPVSFLRPNGGPRRGANVVAPVRDARGHLTGWVMVSFESGLLARAVAAQVPGTQLLIRDNGAVLLAGPRRSGALVRSVAVAGRVWTVSVWAPAGSASAAPWLVLGLGLLISGLVTLALRQALGRESYALGLIADRDRQRDLAEAELKRERRDLRQAQTIAGVGSWDYDLTGERAGRWSEALWRMLGLPTRDEAPPLHALLAFVHPDDQDRIRRRFDDALAGRTAFVDDFRVLRAGDGEELWVALRGELIRDDGGKVVSAFGTVQDITERAGREREQTALRLIADLVAAHAEPAEVFTCVAEQLCELFSGHNGAVARYYAGRGVAVVVSGRSPGNDDLAGLTFDLSGPSAPAVAHRSRGPARADRALTDGADQAGPFDRAVAAPITIGGELWGCVAAGFGDRTAPEGAEQRLGRFAELVAMAVANADQWEQMARRAATDPLTGLANHRTFHDQLRHEIRRAQRYERQLSVAVLDLDHFKAINDTHGHQVGDRVLVEFARCLREESREGELIARIGGEEFAWLMPETDSGGAYQAAERLRREVESRTFASGDRLTFSAGVCSNDNAVLGATELLRFADRALYWAKDSGRNATFLYSHDAHRLLSAEARPVERHQTMSSVRALARAIDSKDPSTREHSERVAELAERLALRCGWSSERAQLLHACGLLHDVGKIGIPDEILLKPGPLTPQEYEQVKRHAELSALIASEVLEDEQVSWIRSHHERWDGVGYPDGLAADRIPDGAQLLAIADAYDVMTQTRTYKAPRAPADALEECRQQAGQQFAPRAVDAIVALRATSVA